MKILAIDVGTGTQDIFLFNSALDMENNFKLIMPSPTMIIRKKILEAAVMHQPIFLDGVIMGGGPSTWAIEAHLRAGLAVYATPEAARTINDDLTVVKALGIELISDDEGRKLPSDLIHIKLCDFEFSAIANAFQIFDVSLADLDAVVVAVFDHGNAPAGISDRQFRFDYLDERIGKLNKLSAFAYRSEDVPPSMTRLRAVVASAHALDFPLVVMDSAPAAVLGASLDPKIAIKEQVIIANIGNFHTLAFRLGNAGIEGLFEHHTGFVDIHKLERLLSALASGTIKREDVFNDQGHGALMYDDSPMLLGKGEFDVVITGPRRSLFDTAVASLRPYFPAPYGDMMITGCFGLLAATADIMPELAEPIQDSLFKTVGKGDAPWDVD